MENKPLIGQAYMYTGEDDESHLNGNTYKVVQTGFHWIRELGEVVWMTDEECPDTTDIDYCVVLDLADFQDSFISI